MIDNRIQLLEHDNKRLSGAQATSGSSDVTAAETQSLIENLTRDVAHLQGQLESTKQLLKQAEVGLTLSLYSCLIASIALCIVLVIVVILLLLLLYLNMYIT